MLVVSQIRVHIQHKKATFLCHIWNRLWILCGALLTHFDIFSLEMWTSKVVAPDLISCSSHLINVPLQECL